MAAIGVLKACLLYIFISLAYEYQPKEEGSERPAIADVREAALEKFGQPIMKTYTCWAMSLTPTTSSGS